MFRRLKGFKVSGIKIAGFGASGLKVPRFWDSRLPGFGVSVFQGLGSSGRVSRFQPFGGSRVIGFEGKNTPRLPF